MIMKFADVEVGKEYPAQEFVVAEEGIRAYLAAVKDNTELYEKERLVPPAYAAVFARWEAVADEQLADGTVHAKQKFEYYKPIHWGEKFSVKGVVKEAKEKRGMKFVVREVDVYDSEGDLVVVSTITVIFPA